MAPVRHAGRFAFATVAEPMPAHLHPVAMIAESEGLSVILPHEVADEQGLEYDYLAAWITLTVQSSLDTVGLTATVSALFAEAGISCNIVAGFYHDHLFVAYNDADSAMKLLGELSSNPQLYIHRLKS
jgi:uncharacterized protein